jgi:hypothetical protein
MIAMHSDTCLCESDIPHDGTMQGSNTRIGAVVPAIHRGSAHCIRARAASGPQSKPLSAISVALQVTISFLKGAGLNVSPLRQRDDVACGSG